MKSRYRRQKMTMTAKFQSLCPECQKPINIGDQIERRRDSKATHPACFKQYFEIRAGGGKIGVFAKTLSDAKIQVDRLLREGCDAEYCHDPANCRKEHYHDINCRCQECFAAEYDADV